MLRLTKKATLALSVLALVSSCDQISDSKEKNSTMSDFKIVGDENQKQGFHLTMPEIPGQELSHVTIDIYSGHVAFANPIPSCQQLHTPPPPSEVPISSDGFSLQEEAINSDVPDNDHDTSTGDGDSQDGDNGDSGNYDNGHVLHLELPVGSGSQEIRLPVSEYTVLMNVYDLSGNVTHTGIDYFQVAANSYSRIRLLLKEVPKPECDGVVIIDYVIEDNEEPNDLIDACEYLQTLPIPSCKPVSTQEVCVLPPYPNYAAFPGSAICEGAGKYGLIKDLCNAGKKMHPVQLEGIKCQIVSE